MGMTQRHSSIHRSTFPLDCTRSYLCYTANTHGCLHSTALYVCGTAVLNPPFDLGHSQQHAL